MYQKRTSSQWIFIVLFIISLKGKAEGAVILEITNCVSNWYQGKPMNLTCHLKSGTPIQKVAFYKEGKPVVDCSPTFDGCISYKHGYNVFANGSGFLTVKIEKFDGAKDASNWTCRDGSTSDSFPVCSIALSAVVCVCDCTVALCGVQAVWMVVVVVYLILCLTLLKDFKPRWIVLVGFGFIQIVLGLISVGCLSIEHTCSSCKSDVYVAGAVFCALSLLCGTVVVIVVLLLKVIRKPSSGTLNVASEGKKRPAPEGQAETVITKDEKKSPQSVPPTATTTVNTSRQLPPDSGNVSGDEGKMPRPLPAPSGNKSPTVTSASQIDTDVNNEAQDDVMRTPGRLAPLEMTETETEKPKKKK